MILPIPDIRQSDEQVCEFYGVLHREGRSIPIDGTSPDTLEAALWSIGFYVISGVMDCDDLRYQTRRGRPVICCVGGQPGRGHWVVVAGVVRGRVHYHCPISGMRSATIPEYVSYWSDTTRRGVVYHQWGIGAYLS